MYICVGSKCQTGDQSYTDSDEKYLNAKCVRGYKNAPNVSILHVFRDKIGVFDMET